MTGHTLRRLRWEKRWSQEQLARLLGVNRNTVGLWEKKPKLPGKAAYLVKRLQGGNAVKEKGFTLVEMIFVLAIIITLISIFLPLATEKLAESKIAKANADTDAIAAALTNFFSDLGNFASCDSTDCDPLNDAANNLRFSAVNANANDPTADLPADSGALWNFATNISPAVGGNPARNNIFNHLVVNNPGTNATTDEAGIDYNTKAWKGPYIGRLGLDPWGHAYIAHIGAMQKKGCPVGSTGTPPACTAPAAGRGWILSAGPDGNLDTGPNATQLANDDIGYIFCTAC